MAKARLCVDTNVSTGNLWNLAAAALTAFSEVTALPATLSQNPDRTKIYRSLTQTGTQTIDIDLGAAYAATCCAIANPKLVGAGTLVIQQRGSAGAPGAAVTVGTLSTVDPDSLVSFVCFASTTARHWRLLWSNPGGASDYAEAGYVFLGQYYEVTVNVTSPIDLPRKALSTINTSDGGQKTVTRRSSPTQIPASYSDFPAADTDAIRAIYRIVDIGTPFFFLLDVSTAWLNWLVSFTDGFTPGISRGPARFNQRAAMEEWL
jgi:hypothetical protein